MSFVNNQQIRNAYEFIKTLEVSNLAQLGVEFINEFTYDFFDFAKNRERINSLKKFKGIEEYFNSIKETIFKKGIKKLKEFINNDNAFSLNDLISIYSKMNDLNYYGYFQENDSIDYFKELSAITKAINKGEEVNMDEAINIYRGAKLRLSRFCQSGLMDLKIVAATGSVSTGIAAYFIGSLLGSSDPISISMLSLFLISTAYAVGNKIKRFFAEKKLKTLEEYIITHTSYDSN